MAVWYCLNLGKLKSLQHVKAVATFADGRARENNHLPFAADCVCGESGENPLYRFSPRIPALWVLMDL